ncbi:CPBP family intramembrane metalloprotease [Staphylococcus chromogenes]|uniref:CPBP family glutamic-type intramembrane protease n=1 Tax=Staphylococcus chromogenes TaxID=46126 RepID=UPI000D023A35|nr:CPBP family intramembrane glutamic endopeptidase [Staphylococcus chromogenes]MCE4971128.1 CPBP family intramembrane metalloprotease [Staphylococcus chromogenes]MDT0655490.1 lysostaphin resistance A-like protein [Staphylococcus chromogenes]PTG03423.1 CPBP family intramembrane metalloprotease [Staphylococcus chromogenes]PTG21900.1 CPBP family intramembrane metalloprotease [Staphylococcus chromogenes]PTG53637.1 CPBP family intramembrane metalloprotease [Staphylococcus chromogenes]
MNHSRISGFQWAMTIFVFFVIAYASPVILRDFQEASGLKNFVFSLNSLGPFIAAIICLLIFKHKKEQLEGFKLGINLKVIERLLLALTIPFVIFIIGMYSFNTFADSFILLQAKDLSESIWTILIGHLFMAFFIEFGFRSYLLNIVERRLPFLFANIGVSLLYLIWDVNTAFGMPYTLYSAIYVFSFSMIVGELVRGTGGHSIYIATLFHAFMSFAKVFFFSEEIGDVFSMQVLAYATAAIAVIVIVVSLIKRLLTPRHKGDDDDTPMFYDQQREHDIEETDNEAHHHETRHHALNNHHHEHTHNHEHHEAHNHDMDVDEETRARAIVQEDEAPTENDHATNERASRLRR